MPYSRVGIKLNWFDLVIVDALEFEMLKCEFGIGVVLLAMECECALIGRVFAV